MHSKIALSAYMLWGATLGCQSLLLIMCKRLPGVIRLYLSVEIGLSIAGMTAAVFSSAEAYFHAFVIAGLIDDAISLVVLLSLFEQLRLRARKSWQSRWLPIGLILITFFAILWTTQLPLPELHLSRAPWRFFMSCTHIAWTWMALIVCLVPLYCMLTAALPDRRLLLLLTGIALYVAVHAGSIDYLIAKRFSHSKLANALSDYSYFFSLALWFAATPTASPAPTRAIHREHQ